MSKRLVTCLVLALALLSPCSVRADPSDNDPSLQTTVAVISKHLEAVDRDIDRLNTSIEAIRTTQEEHKKQLDTKLDGITATATRIELNTRTQYATVAAELKFTGMLLTAILSILGTFFAGAVGLAVKTYWPKKQEEPAASQANKE